MRVGVSSRSFGLSSEASGRVQQESKKQKSNVIRDAPAPAKEAHEEEMTIRHAAALALVSWYLMMPPTGRDYSMGNVGVPRTPEDNYSHLSSSQVEKEQALMLNIDQTLAPDEGIPGRYWYRNLIYAPGRYTGYEAKTLPGVREAIEDRRWSDADRYAKLTADALNAYSNRLDQATANSR